MPDVKSSGLLRIMSSSSSSNDADAGSRWWRRAAKLGSHDYTMRERPANDAADPTGDGGGVATGAAPAAPVYRTYKRRWFGLFQLTLMNVVVSWDVSHH